MNGIHDMGGLHGFGPVQVEPDEPVFHTRWGARVYAMTQAIDTTGVWNLDEHRHEIERIAADVYLSAGYYGRWLFAMERLMDRKNIVRHDEMALRVDEMAHDAAHFTPLPPGERGWPLREEDKVHWGAWRHEVTVQPRYVLGQQVRVRNLHPPGHTRVTAYTRGRVGTVQIVNAQAWVLPDTRAHYEGENLQAVYNVRFSARELWGPQAEANTWTHIDMSEDHLEAVEESQ